MVETLKKELEVPLLQQLSPGEWNIICDYTSLMKPLACGLDRLQGEINASFGYILPTLYSIKKKISQSRTNTTFGDRMRVTLLTCFNKRFDSLMKFDIENMDLVVASVSHPFFKLKWIEDENDREKARQTFINTVLSNDHDNDEQVNIELREMDDDFFENFENGNTIAVRRNSVDSRTMEALNYFTDNGKDLNNLRSFPNVKKVFLKFNATLSSSSPVERLFSQALIIFTPRRNRLSSVNFERTLFLKHNYSLLNIE